MKKYFFLSFCISLVTGMQAYAQTVPMKFGQQRSTDTVPQVQGQNANFYNKITDLIQASIKNGIISKNGSTYELATSIYGLKQLFRAMPFTDKEYIDQKFQRNFNFSFDVGISANNEIQSFNPSIKYAFVNKRDVKNFANAPQGLFDSLYNANLNLNRQISTVAQRLQSVDLDALSKQTGQTKKALQDEISNVGSLRDSTANQLLAFFKKFKSSMNAVDSANIEKAIVDYKDVQSKYQPLVKAIQQGPLFTSQVGSTLKSNSIYGITGKIEYLIGTGWAQDKNKPWDFDTYISTSFQRDSLSNSTDLSRQLFSAYVGLNKVLLYTKQQPNKTASSQSLLEIKGSAGVDYLPWIKFAKESTLTFNMDFVVSVRLANNFYLPFEIKYAPSKSNLFGFLNLQYKIPTITK